MKDEWKHIRRRRAQFLESPQFTRGEKKYLEFQWHMAGGFYTSLWQTIARADNSNLEKLRAGFPEEVAAYLSWTRGDLARRVENFGADT